MRELLLLRHAKSSWKDPELTDHQRPLNKRGTKAAARMGRYLAEHDLVPDLVMCSDAVRTHDTLTLMLKHLGPPSPEAIITADLYHAELDDMLHLIKRQADKAKRLMVIGHNPGLQTLALNLAKTSKSRDLGQLATKFPTAALAHFRFNVSDWRDIEPTSATLQKLVTPRTLAD